MQKRDQGHSAVPPLLIIINYPLEIVNAEDTPHFPCGTQGAGSKRFAEARINRLFSGDKVTFLLFPVIVFHNSYDNLKKPVLSRKKEENTPLFLYYVYCHLP